MIFLGLFTLVCAGYFYVSWQKFKAWHLFIQKEQEELQTDLDLYAKKSIQGRVFEGRLQRHQEQKKQLDFWHTQDVKTVDPAVKKEYLQALESFYEYYALAPSDILTPSVFESYNDVLRLFWALSS